MLNALRTSCNTAYAYLGMELGGAALKAADFVAIGRAAG